MLAKDLQHGARRLARQPGFAVDLGFEPRGISVVEVSLPLAKYPDVESRRLFFEQALERVRQIPGVTAAGLSDYVPGTPAPHTPLTSEEAPAPDLDHMPLVWRKIVAPGTFRALGARLVAGRDFSPLEAPDGPLAAIVNRTLARQLFGRRPAVGKRLILGRIGTTAEVVRVVADLQEGGLDQAKGPEVFLSAHQARKGMSPSSAMQLLVQSDLPPIAVERAVRREILALDPEQLTAELETLEGVLAAGLALGVAAALALSRLLAGQLFEVSPTDPVQLAGAPLLLGAVALLACYLPARRALRVDPAITLRAE